MVVHGSGFPTDALPAVRVGGHPAMVAFVSPTRMVVLVPAEVEGENLILEIENDGEYMDVQFVRNNGEVVIGVFKLVGWAEGPAAFHNDVIRRLRTPVVGMTWTKPR